MQLSIFRVSIRPFLDSVSGDYFGHVHILVVFISAHSPLPVKANWLKET